MERLFKSMGKRLILTWLLTITVFLLAGCAEHGEEEESGYKIWYMNDRETKVDFEYQELLSENTEGMLQEALQALRKEPAKEGYKPVLPEDVRIESYKVENDQLYLNFSAEYMNMSKTYEVLCRAAFVRTLCQIPEIGYVGFRVEDQPLTELNGKVVGLMNEDQFIENAGEDINANKVADLTLYYTNETGDKLVKQRVALEYNTNISLERLVVERLIEGPPFEGAYPTIPAQTKLVSVTVRDGVCYVNLDEGFLSTGYNVTESIPVYSIVNSLIENTDVQKVQISINGETNRVFWESISFDTIFEKNEELIQ